MRLLFLLLIAPILQEVVPYKEVDDFDVILDYQFKTYKEKEPKTVDYSSHRRGTGPLLYLVANVKLKKIAANEFRIRVTNNLASIGNKKAEQDMILKVDFGFIADVKDRMTAHEYTIFLLSPEKTEVSRIHLFIDKDGTFLVNGQKRGKF